jgi:hypothetical protein
MSLKDDTQQNIQTQLDFSSGPTGEARQVGGRETESSRTTNGSESPARTDRLMEEVCERENLKQALRQVKANKGSAGVDGMTVGGITDYLKQHWPAIREQLLNGTYEPKPVRRAADFTVMISGDHVASHERRAARSGLREKCGHHCASSPAGYEITFRALTRAHSWRTARLAGDSIPDFIPRTPRQEPPTLVPEIRRRARWECPERETMRSRNSL